ncbi:MAG: sigma-70 family RNA polymerase sigma factor [Planctomycetota bacterium]
MTPSPQSPADRAERWCSDAGFVRALAGQLVADAHVADDVAQEAWVRALRGPGPRDGFRGWIGRVVHNLAVSNHRRRVARVHHEACAAAARTADDPAAATARLEAHELLVAAVRTLDEPYRTAIVLRYFEGLSPRAIAARRGLPVRTVHTHLQRALAQLREKLHAHDRGRWQALFALPALPAATTAFAMTSTTTKLTALAGLGVAALAAFGYYAFADDAVRPPAAPERPAPAVAGVDPAPTPGAEGRRDATAPAAPAALRPTLRRRHRHRSRDRARHRADARRPAAAAARRRRAALVLRGHGGARGRPPTTAAASRSRCPTRRAATSTPTSRAWTSAYRPVL